VAACFLAGSVGQPAGNQNVTVNAGAKDLTLSIASNSIVGGKNSSGATWITDYVIRSHADEKAGRQRHGQPDRGRDR